MKTFDKDELRWRVAEVLHYVWDPIGVAMEPAARGEYEEYVPKVLELVEINNSPDLIAAYLSEVAEKQMGYKPNAKSVEHDSHVAQLLLDHKDAIKDGLW